SGSCSDLRLDPQSVPRNRSRFLRRDHSLRDAMQISVAHEFLPKSNSVRASVVMDHFGIGFEQGRHVIADGLELPIEPGDVVLFTGASGSGKSSLMRTAAQQLAAEDEADVLLIDALDLGDKPLIESLPGEPAESMAILSQCGLG